MSFAKFSKSKSATKNEKTAEASSNPKETAGDPDDKKPTVESNTAKP